MPELITCVRITTRKPLFHKIKWLYQSLYVFISTLWSKTCQRALSPAFLLTHIPIKLKKNFVNCGSFQGKAMEANEPLNVHDPPPWASFVTTVKGISDFLLCATSTTKGYNVLNDGSF